jgi:phage terminase large subunit GpA-like protein
MRAASALRPKPIRSPWKWAEENRQFPAGSAEPGPYRSDRTPYLVPLQEACVSPRYRGAVAVLATQMGKTATVMNIVGRKLDDDPAPVIYFGPTKSNLETVVEPQISAMLRGVESLRKTMPGGKAQKKLVKKVAGVTLRMAWAGSPTELASQPAHTAIVDEVDKMEPVKGEGDPLTLARARVATYADGNLFAVSSPTEGTVTTKVHPETGIEHWELADPQDVPSRIWRAWQEGTRHEWAVPCRHCSEYFVPRFKLLQWSKEASPAEARRSARLVCSRCGALHSDADKLWMNEHGRAIAPGQKVVDGQVVGEPPESDTFSLWVSGLMSPWKSFGLLASNWVSAAHSGDQDIVRTTLNADFGELYMLRGQAPEWQSLKQLGAGYKLGDVPKGVRLLFLTADVQKNRLVCTVRGWGAEFESWLIHTEEIWGDTDQPEVYARLTELYGRRFGSLPISAAAIDSGFRTERVYEWAHAQGLKAYATFGRERPSKLYAAFDIEVDRYGKRRFAGMKRWVLDHGYFKGWVHDRLGWPPDQPGAWHLPDDVEDDYCKQLVAEQRLRLPSGGVQWVKSGANDWLDCEALQVFLAHVEGVRNLKKDAPAKKGGTVADLARKLNHEE